MTAHTDTSHRTAPAWHRLRSLLAFGAATVLVGWLGSLATSASVNSEWFRSLDKPPFYPPDALFGIVWTFIYVGIAAAGWLGWRRGGRLDIVVPWTAQLVFNLTWTLVFFGLQEPAWAMAVIVALLVTSTWTALAMWRHSRLATALFVPYILWIGFAGALNWAIVALN